MCSGGGWGTEPPSQQPPLRAAQPPWSSPTNRPWAVAMQQAVLLCSAQRTANGGQRTDRAYWWGCLGLPPAPPLPLPSPCSPQSKFTECFPLTGRAGGQLAQTKEVPPPPLGGHQRILPLVSRRKGLPRQLLGFPCPRPTAMGPGLGPSVGVDASRG